MNPLLYTDFYKVHHGPMYPENMTMLVSNFTPRKSRLPGVNKAVVFSIQRFIMKYLIDKFNKNFFEQPLEKILEEYRRHVPVDTSHIEELWHLNYLPIEIRALPEGSQCPIGVPLLVVRNTHPNFGWLTNYLETLISCSLWQGITSATIAYEFKKLLSKYAILTTGSEEFTQWQGHDFSMRGMSSVESCLSSGMGHLLSFTGTDTVPAIYAMEHFYNGQGLIGASVPATEHSVMCMGTKEEEIETFRRLMRLFPTGILSIVSDTWDLWKVCTEYLPQLKEEILARDGKIVIRPDSGNPVDIVCGLAGKDGYHLIDDNHRIRNNDTGISREVSEPEVKGVVELLWDLFGGTINAYGYKELDPHIGTIYGDGITLERAEAICSRLMAKGFASTNVVFGIGSYTYQCNTRDTLGFAMKATYGEVWTPEGIQGREIFKAPVTDSGEKKSARGLLKVIKNQVGEFELLQQCSWDQVNAPDNELQVVFSDGKLVKFQTLEEIRNRLKN